MALPGVSPLLETVGTGLARADGRAISAVLAVTSPEATADVAEFSAGAIALTQARTTAAALVKVLHADEESSARLLDILA